MIMISFPHETTKPVIPKVDLSQPAAQGTYEIAKLLMEAAKWFLSLFGLEHNDTLFTAVYAILVFLISIGVGYIIKLLVILVVRKLGNKFQNNVYKY